MDEACGRHFRDGRHSILASGGSESAFPCFGARDMAEGVDVCCAGGCCRADLVDVYLEMASVRIFLTPCFSSSDVSS